MEGYAGFGTFHIRLLPNPIDAVPEAELDAHLRRTADHFIQLFRPDEGLKA